MKYYVMRKNRRTGKIEVKRYQYLYTYVPEKEKMDCWQYSKQGATAIAERENAHEAELDKYVRHEKTVGKIGYEYYIEPV